MYICFGTFENSIDVVSFFATSFRAFIRSVEAALVEEDGQSVLEVTVALALLVAVLVPATGMLVHIMTRHSAYEKTRALARAQAVMESTVDGPYTDRVWESRDGEWIYQRVVTQKSETVKITVRVWKQKIEGTVQTVPDRESAMSLSTTRLAP